MASSVSFDSYGPFNSIMQLNQTNWANYFSPTIPDGIMAGIEDEMSVYGNSSGMYVYVMKGECRVRSHRGVLSAQATLDIAAADLTYDRIDLVVARVTYGDPSTMVVAVKTGTPALTPAAPELTQTAGDVWEIPLAEVYVAVGDVTIADTAVKDRRFVYTSEGMAPVAFSDTTLTVENYRSYRGTAQLNSLQINLPDNPSDIWQCSIDFRASSSFTGFTFVKGSTTLGPNDIILDRIFYHDLGIKNTWYHVDITWMGQYYLVTGYVDDSGKPIMSFSGTSLSPESYKEYRASSSLNSLAITLPNSPASDFTTVVCFTASSSFTGVTFSTSKTVKSQGVSLSIKSVRYNLVIYYDGTYYWCNAQAA